MFSFTLPTRIEPGISLLSAISAEARTYWGVSGTVWMCAPGVWRQCIKQTRPCFKISWEMPVSRMKAIWSNWLTGKKRKWLCVGRKREKEGAAGWLFPWLHLTQYGDGRQVRCGQADAPLERKLGKRKPAEPRGQTASSFENPHRWKRPGNLRTSETHTRSH